MPPPVDEDPTTEWVSHSNTYDVTTGDYLEGFSGTPPATITLTGSWGTNGWSSYADLVAAQSGSSYVRTTYTQDYALYDG